MKRVYQVTGVTSLIFSIFVLHQAVGLQYYTLLGPGPGFFPFWIALVLGVLSAGMIYQSSFKESEPLPGDFFPERRGLVRMGAIVLAMVASVLLLDTLGFRLTMLAFFLFLLLTLGRHHPIVTVLVAVAGSFGAFYLFDTLLQVPLPIGRFGI